MECHGVSWSAMELGHGVHKKHEVEKAIAELFRARCHPVACFHALK